MVTLSSGRHSRTRAPVAFFPWVRLSEGTHGNPTRPSPGRPVPSPPRVSQAQGRTLGTRRCGAAGARGHPLLGAPAPSTPHSAAVTAKPTPPAPRDTAGPAQVLPDPHLPPPARPVPAPHCRGRQRPAGGTCGRAWRQPRPSLPVNPMQWGVLHPGGGGPPCPQHRVSRDSAVPFPRRPSLHRGAHACPSV